MRSTALIAMGLCVCLTFPADAQDVEGASDHPLIPRISGSELITYEYTEFDRVTLPFGEYLGDGEWEDSRTLEGEHIEYSYILREPSVSTLQVKRAYLQGLQENGFEIVFTGSGRDDLGRRFRSQDIFDRPRHGNDLRSARRRSNLDSRFIAASHSDGSLLATALIYQNREHEPVVKLNVLEEQRVTLELETAPATPAEEATEEVTADEEEVEAEAEIARADLTTAEMQDSIVEQGRVAVQDIQFEFDSAQIRPESGEVLATIAELMNDTPDLDILVVGHTDTVGDFGYNLELSMERANAVSIYLQLEHGIPGDRLQAAGAGMMAPIATNRTEEGRAQNRRVELVEIAD